MILKAAVWFLEGISVNSEYGGKMKADLSEGEQGKQVSHELNAELC